MCWYIGRYRGRYIDMYIGKIFRCGYIYIYMRVDGVRGRGRCLCPLLFPLIPFVGNGGVEWSDHLFYICPFEWSSVLHVSFSVQCLIVSSSDRLFYRLFYICSFRYSVWQWCRSDHLFHICPFWYSVWQWYLVIVCFTYASFGTVFDSGVDCMFV